LFDPQQLSYRDLLEFTRTIWNGTRTATHATSRGRIGSCRGGPPPRPDLAQALVRGV
jgi:hypothetical protein